MFHLTSYYRHTRSRPNAMLDQIGLLLYQRQLLSFESQCTLLAATVPVGAGVAFQDHGREPRNVSNGSTMGRFFLRIHSDCFAVLWFYITHISILPFSKADREPRNVNIGRFFSVRDKIKISTN